MSGYSSKLADKNFINWIKAILASNIVKEGLEELVEKKMNLFHQNVLNNIATKEQIKKKDLCSSCTIENVLQCQTQNMCKIQKGQCLFHDTQRRFFRPCPRNLCNSFQEIIRKSHRFNCPSWKNTKTEKWCKSPVEVAKCYLPRDGYIDKTSIQMIDLNGILSILLSHSDFSSVIDENSCTEVRKFMNNIRHSSNLCIDDQNLKIYIRTLIDFLECSSALKTDVKAKAAVKTLHELLTGNLSIQEDITKVLQEAIEDKTKQSAETLSDKAKQELNSLKEALEEHKRKCISEIDLTKEVAQEEIRATASSVMKQIEALGDDRECDKQNYEQLKDKFKDDLLLLNEYWHQTIPVSPLFEETDASISEFYIRPDLFMVKGDLSNPGRAVSLQSLNEMFQKTGKSYNEIYLTADAGFGKTSFTKYLVNSWCHAVKQFDPQSQASLTEDECAMKRFNIVILLQLRDMCNICDIDEMILEHIVNQCSHSSNFNMKILQEILHKETCLIILDGLDEWSHPVSSCNKMPKSIPHRKIRPTCTVLTTSRPWKLGTINIKSSQINLRVELSGLNEWNIFRLKEVASLKLVEKGKVSQFIEGYNEEVKRKELGSLESNPMLLMYLLCIWREEQSLGTTKTELYRQIIDLMLSRAEHKVEWSDLEEQAGLELKTSKTDIPKCFRDDSLCCKYFMLLRSFGRLGFERLLSKERDQAILFDDSVADGYMSKEEKRLGLLSGILNESRIPGVQKRQRFKVSFCHKTIQEYLAALYMTVALNQTEITEEICRFMSSVDCILEMATLLVFVSSLNHEMFLNISQKMAEVVDNDEITLKYRHGCISSTSDYTLTVKPLKDVQSMYMNCIKEVQNQIPLKLYLKDLFLHGDCFHDTNKASLQKLKRLNKCGLKSLDIRTEGISRLRDIIDTFDLQKESELTKINFRGACEIKDLECLLNGSAEKLKCVELLSSSWINGKFKSKYIIWLDTLLNTFQKMKTLEALHLYSFAMTHNQLSQIMHFIEEKPCMRDIALLNFKCTDHSSVCQGCALDLSRHDALRLLSLDNIPLSHLLPNFTVLEDVVVGKIPSSDVLSTFLSAMKTGPKVRKFTCRNISSDSQIDAILRTLNEMVSLQYIGLINIDLGERNLLLGTKLSNIELMRFAAVTMNCSLVRNLIKEIKQFCQEITVVLSKCIVRPEMEFEMMKKDLQKDEKVLIISDNNEQFVFSLSVKHK